MTTQELVDTCRRMAAAHDKNGEPRTAATLRAAASRLAELQEILRSGSVASVVGGDLVNTMELRPAPPPRNDGCDFLLVPITAEVRAALGGE